MHVVDLVIFLVFTLGVVLFGCSFFKRNTSSDEFTSASRSLPGWVVGMSIFATYVSSISYLGYPGKAFASNWNALVFSFSIPVASYFAARYFVPFYRRSGNVSAYAFLEERFGRWARLYASTCYLLTQIARMGSILYLLAVPMHILMGWNMHVVIVATSLAVVAYSMLGGIRAVIWVDAVQGILLIGGALLCLGVVLFSMPDGPMQAFDIAVHAPEGNKFSLGAFTSDLTTSTFWVCLVYGIFINLQNYGIDQNYVQRYHTARSDHDARFSALFGGWLFIPVSAIFFLIGTALYSYYTVVGGAAGALPAEIAAKPDYVFPYFIVSKLPVGVRGLLIASIFAAGMSTVSTSVSSGATIVLKDFFGRMSSKVRECEGAEVRDLRDIFILRFSSLSLGVLGAIVAIAMLSVQSIIDAWWTLSSIFSGGMLGLFLLGWLSTEGSPLNVLANRAKRPRRRALAALAGVICGVLVIAWISLAPHISPLTPHLHEYLAIVLGTTAIFLVGFLCLFVKNLA